MQSQDNLDKEIPLVIQIYSVVGALGIALNLCLLYCMLDTRYWSTTAVFLTIIAVLNLQESIALLVNLFQLSNGYATYSASDYTRSQKINQFQQLLWSFSCILIMLLVAVDRGLVLNTKSWYLFMNYRKTKVCCSLAAIVVLVVVINHILPLTVDIMLRDEKVQVFICITYFCHGSPLLMQKWRWPDDMRADINMTCLKVYTALCLAFLPIYGCIWRTVSRKEITEKKYENERAKMTLQGQEVVYFNDIRVSILRRQSGLPVIYEVDEENDSLLEKGVVFPYTLQIWHNSSSLCSLNKENTFFYDEQPVPENARPVLVNTFDSTVDKHPRFYAFHTKRKLPRLATKSSFHARRNSLDLNRNALSPPSVWAKPMVHMEAASRPPSQEASVETCPNCLYKRNIYHHRDTFSTRQIVFSINCCCNRGPPIDCYTDIMYLNGGDYCETARPFNASRAGNYSRNLETMEDHITSYRQTFRPNSVSGNLQDMAFSDTNITHTISEPHCLHRLVQEDTNDIEMKLNQKHSNYPHYGDCSGGSFSSCEFSEGDSVVKTTTKPCKITNQQPYTFGSTRATNDLAEEYFISQLCPQKCDRCKKHILQYKSVNANWNNDFRTRIRKAKLRKASYKIKQKQRRKYKGNEIPMVDFKSAKSQSISLAVKEHYSKHSPELEPIGIPPSLKVNIAALKITKTKYTISRLIFQTLCYFVACGLPCLIELAIVPYSTVLYMSSYFKVLIQFISLLIFSRDFKHRLMKCFFWKK